MKSKITHVVDHRIFKNEKAEQENKVFTNNILDQAHQKAKRDAEDGAPLLSGDSLLAHLATINGEVQQQNDRNREYYGADDSIELTKNRLKNEQSDLRNERDEQAEKVKQELAEYEKLKTDYPSILAKVIAAVILLLCIMEGLLLTESIRNFMPNRLTALAISLVLGGGLGILAHKFPKWWNLGSSKIQKYTIRTLLIGGFSFVFYSLGLLRSYQQKLSSLSIEESSGGDIFTLSEPKESVMYMMISWLVFSMAIILTKYSPTFEQWKSIFRLSAQRKELKKAEHKLEDSKSKLAANQQELDNLDQWDYSRKTKGYRQEQALIKLLTLAKDTYISSNMKYRRGHQRPDCFDDKGYRYYLTTYFQEVDTSDLNSNRTSTQNNR